MRTLPETVLTTQIENRDGVHLVHLSGPLDSTTRDQFKILMESLVGQAQVRIVLDCENLTYVNSTGLMMLLRHQRVAIHRMSFLGVAAFTPRNLKAVDLFGLGSMLKLYSTVEEALQAASDL